MQVHLGSSGAGIHDLKFVHFTYTLLLVTF